MASWPRLRFLWVPMTGGLHPAWVHWFYLNSISLQLPTVPAWVDFVIISVCVSVFALTWWGISQTVRKLYPTDRAWRLSYLAAMILTGWFLSALFITMVVRPPNTTSLGILTVIGWVLGIVGVGYGLRFYSATYREIVQAIPQSWLIGVQFYRNIGAVFLVLMAMKVLPPHFAYPAGVGDLLAGLPTLLVAYLYVIKPARMRGAAFGVNVLGLLDFLVALGIGTNLLHVPAEAVFGSSTGTTSVLPLFPLGLIPTVVIPLGFILHLHSLTNLLTARPDVSVTGDIGVER